MHKISYTRLKERKALGIPPPSRASKRRRCRLAAARALRRKKRELLRTWLALPGIKAALALTKPTMGTIEHLLQLTGTTKQLFLDILYRAQQENEPAAIKFTALWENLTTDEREAQDLDSFCKLVKMRPSALIGVFIEHICKLKQHAAIVKAAMALDSIVDASIEFSKAKDGIDDRRILLKNQKFIEDKPSTPAVIIDQRQQTAILGERSFEAVIKGHDTALLDAVIEPIEAEVIDMPIEAVIMPNTLQETND